MSEPMGELVPVGGGDAIPLLMEVLTIGRRETCDICLKFQNISGVHCELSRRNGVWHIRDMGSTNGIKVNGERTQRRPLRPGDEVTISTHRYTIQYTPPDNGALEDVFTEEEDVFGQSLMEKAGLALAGRILALGRSPQASRIDPQASPGDPAEMELGDALRRCGALVLVGPGHNGGDGLVVARELHLAGLAVRLWCPFERRKPLTEAHWRHAQWLGLPALEQAPAPDDPAIWIDALFGIGQQRPLEERIGALLEERRHTGAGRDEDGASNCGCNQPMTRNAHGRHTPLPANMQRITLPHSAYNDHVAQIGRAHV